MPTLESNTCPNSCLSASRAFALCAAISAWSHEWPLPQIDNRLPALHRCVDSGLPQSGLGQLLGSSIIGHSKIPLALVGWLQVPRCVRAPFSEHLSPSYTSPAARSPLHGPAEHRGFRCQCLCCRSG